jgi:2-polyprenyl-3-methyl-5-hydroxy-6-metoxy-1,4-benzoquinol methylase
MNGSEEWNRRYEKPEFIYGLSPNEFLKQQLSELKPSTLLLPGEGEGRNALWAAQNGWDVTAFDYSEAAKKKALSLFSKYNVNPNYSVSDVLSFNPHKKFDAIALIYLHLPKDIQPVFFKRLIQMLNPLGYLILEIFHPDQISRTSGGPKNPELFVTQNELAEHFKSLSIKHIAKEEIELNEGALHQGKALVIRLIAQKL